MAKTYSVMTLEELIHAYEKAECDYYNANWADSYCVEMREKRKAIEKMEAIEREIKEIF